MEGCYFPNGCVRKKTTLQWGHCWSPLDLLPTCHSSLPHLPTPFPPILFTFTIFPLWISVVGIVYSTVELPNRISPEQKYKQHDWNKHVHWSLMLGIALNNGLILTFSIALSSPGSWLWGWAVLEEEVGLSTSPLEGDLTCSGTSREFLCI